ncbi:MAG: MFS transporter [Myxococcales bacterium]|nr:MFS transporter [Myxococcales bacterium]
MGRVTNERVAFMIQMIVAFLAMTTMSGTRPTTTYRALDLGAGAFEVGLVQSAYSVLPAIGAVLIGRWVDRFGEVLIYSAAMFGLAAGAMVSALADALVVLGFGQVLIGFGTAAMLIASQAMIANRSRPEAWNRNYGTYAAFLSLGNLVGPTAAAQIMTLPNMGSEPERAAFAVTGLASIVGALLILALPRTRVNGPSDGPAADGAFRVVVARILRRPGMIPAMFVSIVIMSAFDVILAYLPILGESKGLSVQLVGLLLSVRAATTLLSRLVMDPLLKRFGWVRMLAGSLAIGSVALVFLPLSVSPLVLVVVMGVFGLGLGFGQPMAVSFVANRATKADRATALAVRLTANRVSLLFVPAVMGAVAGGAGVDAVFWMLAGIMAAGSVVAVIARLEATPGPEPAARQ